MNTEQKLITLELITNKKNFSAMSVSKLYAAHQGYIDWHNFSDYLSELFNKGLLVITGHDTSGMCIYNWNR